MLAVPPRPNVDSKSRSLVLSSLVVVCAVAGVIAPAPLALGQATSPQAMSIDRAQTQNWSADDMNFFLHGSMSTEVIPENVLTAFRATYPQLFGGKDLTSFGLIPDADSDLPIGVSRRSVPHLGGLTCIGVNCASCHVVLISPRGSADPELGRVDGGPTVRVIGAASHFDNEAFFGSVIVATFQTADPANMRAFLRNYYAVCEPQATAAARDALASELAAQSEQIASAVAAQLTSEKTDGGARLYELDAGTLTLNDAYLKSSRDLSRVATSVLRLFHNMRAALHVPQQPFDKLPPASGPGRNNAFGVLSLALFGEPTVYAPVKFGIAWNLHDRAWVHWDGNTRLPLIRNLAASLGLGAPLVGKHGVVDFSLVERHTKLSEQVRSPKYPWKIDGALAERGKALFAANCAKCHATGTADEPLFAATEVGTDANRAMLFSPHQAEMYNRFFAELDIAGYTAPKAPPIRSTEKYVAPRLEGVWARSPYLHNGSVRTMKELLMPAEKRETKFHRGSRVYDESALGFVDDGAYLLDTAAEGNSNRGHEYGTKLGDDEKQAMIEYLKTL